MENLKRCRDVTTLRAGTFTWIHSPPLFPQDRHKSNKVEVRRKGEGSTVLVVTVLTSLLQQPRGYRVVETRAETWIFGLEVNVPVQEVTGSHGTTVDDGSSVLVITLTSVERSPVKGSKLVSE